jgi:hypothetical protein
LYDQGGSRENTIAWMMASVAIAALDFAAMRALFGFGPSTGELLTLGALPMANILAVGFLIGYRCPGSRPFLLGFEAFGVVALAVYIALVISSPASQYSYMKPLIDPLERNIGRDRPFVFLPIVCFVAVVMLGWPQVIFALIGGFLSRRFKITITPR